MFSLHPSFRTPDQTELSRQAAERYAVLSAVRQRRAEGRGVVLHGHADQVRPARFAIEVSTETSRC